VDPSDKDISTRARQLANLVRSHNELTGYIVGEVFTQSFANPIQIDTILSTFNQLAQEFVNDETYSDYGFKGKKAILKALDAELLEMLQTPGVPIVDAGPYDVSCPINVSENVDAAAKRVLEYAKARNKWLIVHAISARQSVLLSEDPDFEMTVVEKAVGINTSLGEPDETDFINGMITIIGSGQHLAAFYGERMEAVKTRLQVRLKTEPNFRLKYFLAAGLQVLNSGEEWTSKRIFNSVNWVY